MLKEWCKMMWTCIRIDMLRCCISSNLTAGSSNFFCGTPRLNDSKFINYCAIQVTSKPKDCLIIM